MNNSVEIVALQKVYKTEAENLCVLDDLSLVVGGGSVAIMGDSGSGKSTLLNIIGTLDEATSGAVKVAGQDVCKMNDAQRTLFRKKSVGLIFQFHYLLKDFTALENVYLPSLVFGEKKQDAIARAHKLLEEVGLAKRADHLPSQLSGGERQRVAVARALVNDPPIILADEPTGNLDADNAKNVAHLLFDMAARHNKTLLLVTHDSKIADCADAEYRLVGGKLQGVRV